MQYVDHFLKKLSKTDKIHLIGSKIPWNLFIFCWYNYKDYLCTVELKKTSVPYLKNLNFMSRAIMLPEHCWKNKW